MKISVIHNLYRKNPYIKQSVDLNLKSLKNASVDYKYILFNDNGDSSIEDDIKEFINNKVKYIYSPINYGKRMCSGGWIGALPCITGNLIHNIGQDDVFSFLFYEIALSYFFKEPDLSFISQNAYRVKEDLSYDGLMLASDVYYDYRYPKGALLQWLGIYPPNYEVTFLRNYFLAPGVIYKKSLHDFIGRPDIENFRAAADFEYWLRILYNGFKGHYISTPTWYYRMSSYSTRFEIIDNRINDGTIGEPGYEQDAGERLLNKYKKLISENKEKFI